MELRTVLLAELKPYENNPRRNDKAVEAVMKSIRQCQYVAPIVVDEDMVILAGHTRLKALQKLGETETQVVVKAGLAEEQKRKYRLLDNKTAELAEWDDELLKAELEGLDFDDLELDWGLEVEPPPEAVEDDFDPEPPAKAKSKRGDLFRLGRHLLLCGDATSPEDVERLLAGRQAGRH